jgi:hypothetical protein
MQKGKLLLILLLPALVLQSFLPKDSLNSESPSFSYFANDKLQHIENLKAVLRTTTGGRKQLSLSNDRFVKFFFINPDVKEFDLSTPEAENAVVRYNEPGTNFIYSPKNGRIRITKLDENAKMLSGEFEMDLVTPGKDKVIKVTRGKFNLPLVVLR